MPLGINTIDRHDCDWKFLTAERYRIDEHTLDALSMSAMHKQKEVKETNDARINTLLDRVHEWIANVLFNPCSQAPLRITTHLLQRAREYQGKVSRNGTYIELYAEERALIEQLTETLKAESKYKIVELGLNGQGNVCKIALLIPFNQWLGEATSRKLFLLIGCDGGLKTFYAVPDFKWRARYRMEEGIKSLLLADLYLSSAHAPIISNENQSIPNETKCDDEKHASPHQVKGKNKEEEDDGWKTVKNKRHR